MEKDKITLKDFRALVKRYGYTYRTKKVFFAGFGSGRFIALYKDGKKVRCGIGTRATVEAFRVEHPHPIEWWKTLKVLDGTETLIFDKE